MLTIDASGESVEPFARVFQIEWKDGDAWRAAIKTYHYGRWQSRLKAMVHPRPWLERWLSVGNFHGFTASAANRCFEIVIEGFCWNRNSSWALVVYLMSRPATPVWREIHL
jgi:hypothetical protein